MASYVTKAQYIEACRTDLAQWLMTHHPHDITKQYGSLLLKEDSHVSVKPGYHGYTNFRTGDTGNNIDYLMTFLGYSYPDAVLALTDGGTGVVKENCVTAAVIPGSVHAPAGPLPPVAALDSGRVKAYLVHARGIPGDIVQALADNGLLYQSRKGMNAVFITPEMDYFELRGTNPAADRRCRHRDDCSSFAPCANQWCAAMETCSRYRPDPFHGGSRCQGTRFWYYKPSPGPSDCVYICESAIDAISLYAINRNARVPGNAVYASIGGAGKQLKIDRIKRKHRHAVIAVDNDDAGNACRRGNPELETIIPVCKDWNDDLRKGVFYGKCQ